MGYGLGLWVRNYGFDVMGYGVIARVRVRVMVRIMVRIRVRV